MSRERVSVVILAKEATAAKSRLQLPPNEASHLAHALAASTVRTVLTAEAVSAVFVVTGDPQIALDALSAGADVVSEPAPLGMNRAADLGRRRALELRPSAPVAIMVADLPQLQSSDIDLVVGEWIGTQSPLYVTDHQGTGTTFLIHGARPYLGVAFGLHSASMHWRLGYRESLTAPRGLRTDLDTREDLDRLGGDDLVARMLVGDATQPGTRSRTHVR